MGSLKAGLLLQGGDSEWIGLFGLSLRGSEAVWKVSRVLIIVYQKHVSFWNGEG